MPNEKIKHTDSHIVRNIIKSLGFLVTIVALAFAIRKVWGLGQSNWDKILNSQVLFATVLGGLLYAVSNLCLALAWSKWLVWFGEAKKHKLCLAVYGRTQIVKYIPGNIFHLPSRHILGYQVGFNHPALVGAAVYELIGLITAAGMVALIGFVTKSTLLDSSTTWLILIVFLLILLPLAAQFLIAKLKIAHRLGFPDRSVLEGLKGFSSILAIYLTFFIFGSVILWIIVGVTTETWTDLPVRLILSTFAISWLTGFVTPGAPAGIGVREATIILILSPFIGEAASVIVAIIMRIIVAVGDLIFFAFSHLYELEATGEGGYRNELETVKK